MARRTTETSDSLDLLLDTMCNAFGGIVMIAILIALLTREASRQERQASGIQPAPAMSDTMFTQIQKDIENLENQNAALEGELWGLSSVQDLIDRRDDLTMALERAEKEVQNLTTTIADEESRLHGEMAGQMKKLNEELAKSEKKGADLKRELADLEESRETLKRAIETIKQERNMIASKNVMRIAPKEAEQSKESPLSFIVRYGELFPVEQISVTPDGTVTGVVQNRSGINWQGNTAIPQKGGGLKIEHDAATIAQILDDVLLINQKNSSNLEKQVYIAGLVYEDSFPTYIQFLKILRTKGISNGWIPIEGDTNLSFGAGGKKPIKQGK